MTRKPKIPMRPEDVPQQRIHEIVTLPPRPAGFAGKVDWIDSMPGNLAPKGSPRKTEFIGAVEWSWSPMHSRFDAYYLNSRGKYWLLWIGWNDDNTWDNKWTWSLYAYGPKKGVPAKEAAIYLLMDAWKAETKDGSLGGFEMIDDAGFLTVDEILSIAREVWP